MRDHNRLIKRGINFFIRILTFQLDCTLFTQNTEVSSSDTCLTSVN